MTLAVSIAIEDTEWQTEIPDIESMAEDTVAYSIKAVRPEWLKSARPVEIGLLFADDATLHALNRQFRHIDRPTNVLSFPANDIAHPASDMPLPAGDIAISFQTVKAEAQRDSKTVKDHTRHMIVHGVLHLLGHDHEDAREAEIMESIESEILAGFGVDNPYIM
jgi:probable rRNA maturation factor